MIFKVSHKIPTRRLILKVSRRALEAAVAPEALIFKVGASVETTMHPKWSDKLPIGKTAPILKVGAVP